jgi:RNA polymerase sigma-70 factor (ECF subfamily)
MEPNGGGRRVDDVTPTFDVFWSDQRDRIGRALAMTVGDLDLATEAVDEAMARAYQRWGRVGTLDNPAGWVYRVGLNWTRSIHRRRRRIPPAWLATPQASTDDPGLDPSIDSAMAALPEAQRAVVVCRLLLGWSEAQTATVLDVRPGTVKSRLSRALDELAVTLDHLDPKEDVR